MAEVKRDSPFFANVVHRKVVSNLVLSGYAAVVAESATFPLDLVSKREVRRGKRVHGVLGILASFISYLCLPPLPPPGEDKVAVV